MSIARERSKKWDVMVSDARKETYHDIAEIVDANHQK